MKCTEIYAVKNNASRSSGMPSPWASGVGLNTSSRASEAWQFKVVSVFGESLEQVCKLGHPSRETCEDMRKELLRRLDLHREAARAMHDTMNAKNGSAGTRGTDPVPISNSGGAFRSTGGRYGAGESASGNANMGSYPPNNVFSPRPGRGYKD